MTEKQNKKGSAKGVVLIVDDEEHIREILSATLTPVSDLILTAENAELGLETIREKNVDLVVCDIRMPGMDGLEFLHQAKIEQPWLRFLMITAHGSMETVIEAMRYGASDFMTKPFDNSMVREKVAHLLNQETRRSPSPKPGNSPMMGGIIGESESLRQCLEIAKKAAQSDSTVLITGESGTGKEVLARAVHENSTRSKKAFIPVNCGAIPENLMESELFGYEKGAFTGALASKPGKFTLGNEGTVFLDEIGEMPTSLQVKVLRVLQEKTVDAVGSIHSTQADFRLIAATNRNLEHEVQMGNFREDLFYRLNIIPIHLPPLRERENDAWLLAQHFLAQFNERYGTSHSLNSSHRKSILGYEWPGNIRELENILERSVVLSDKDQFELKLPVRMTTTIREEPAAEKNLIQQSRMQAEKQAILQALEKNRWNKTRTASELGISRRSLLYKVKEYDIE